MLISSPPFTHILDFTREPFSLIFHCAAPRLNAKLYLLLTHDHLRVLESDDPTPQIRFLIRIQALVCMYTCLLLFTSSLLARISGGNFGI